MDKKVFVVMITKDEEDIIGYNIEWLQTQDIDHFFIANNLSTDNTKKILLELSEKYGNMTIIDDKEFAYAQDQKMNRWIPQCYDMGADIIVAVDSDEKWYSKIEGKTLGQALKEYDGDYVFKAYVTDFVPTKNDPESDNPFESMIYAKQNSDSFPAVAFTRCSQARITAGNHDVLNHPGKVLDNVIGIKHYQYRSFNQFVKKMRNGKRIMDLSIYPDYTCSHWRERGSWSKDQLLEWWENYISQPVKLYNDI